MALDRQLRTLVKERVDRTLVGRRDGVARARMFASFVLVALGVGWWAAFGGATSGRLYNPGHVSAAHAQLERDCNACHGGKAAPGESDAAHFRRPVADAACLACHDGAIHHPNQLVADDMAGVSRATLTLAVKDASRDASSPTRAADCASCHVEHRGEALMAGRANEHCAVCHADLKHASTADDVERPNSVTAFDREHHPPFGRKLMAVPPAPAFAAADAPASPQRRVDPTKLKFNHLKHLTEVEPLGGDRSCVTCHELSLPAAEGAPGAAMPAQAYTAPVSYERHCAGCHKIDVPGTKASYKPVVADLVAPHRAMADVRAFLGDRVRQALDGPADAFAVEDEDAPGVAPADATPEQKDAANRRLWVWANLKEYAANANAGRQTARDAARKAAAERLGKAESDLPADDAPAEVAPADATPSGLVDAMTANLALVSCLKCHELTDQSLPKPGAAYAAETVPTLIPKGVSRRWYTASRFDHRAHRDMSCVECHASLSSANLRAAAALPMTASARRSVTDTDYVNSPGLTWSTLPAGAGSERSCAQCHHADDATGRGATADCAACHNFHDRTRERPILANPTTVPATPREVAAAP